jgi:hypothetical protein
MLGMQHQVGIEQAGGILRRLLALDHPQEVGRVRQLRVGRHRGLAAPEAMVRRHDHGNLRRQPDALAHRGRP